LLLNKNLLGPAGVTFTADEARQLVLSLANTDNELKNFLEENL
jgi:hypothetical protein